MATVKLSHAEHRASPVRPPLEGVNSSSSDLFRQEVIQSKQRQRWTGRGRKHPFLDWSRGQLAQIQRIWNLSVGNGLQPGEGRVSRARQEFELILRTQKTIFRVYAHWE